MHEPMQMALGIARTFLGVYAVFLGLLSARSSSSTEAKGTKAKSPQEAGWRLGPSAPEGYHGLIPSLAGLGLATPRMSGGRPSGEAGSRLRRSTTLLRQPQGVASV
jgi:hypothetical protein